VSELAPREEVPTEGAHIAPRVGQPLVPRVEQPLAFREDLPVPEPWSRTIWEVTKPLPLSIGLMYGMQQLLWPDEPFGWRWFLWMGGFFAVQGAFQRRKGMYHWQGLIAFGALTSAVAVAFTGIGIFAKDDTKTPLAMGIVFLALGVVTLVAGFRARTLERERTARLLAEQADATPIPGAIPVVTLRERVQRFKERMSRANKKLIAGFASVLGVTFGGLTVGDRFGWPDSVYMGLFFFFWAGLGGVMWYSSRVMRKAAKESELECPACMRPLVNLLGSARLSAQLEDLGRCPQCAARITQEVL